MQTRDIIEELLFLNPDVLFQKKLTAAHIGSNFSPKQHIEYHFLERWFKKPDILVLIDIRIHVYIIGKKVKSEYKIIEVNGSTSSLLSMKKSDFVTYLKKIVTEQTYLPEPFVQRVIWMADTPVVFNRIGYNENLLHSADWSLGADYYKANKITYKAKLLDIIKACLKEI